MYIERAEQCCYGCGYFSSGKDLDDHESREHTTCTECGNEPIGNYPVAHKASCSHITIAPHLWPSPTGPERSQENA